MDRKNRLHGKEEEEGLRAGHDVYRAVQERTEAGVRVQCTGLLKKGLKVDHNMYTVWIERTGCTEKRKRKDLLQAMTCTGLYRKGLRLESVYSVQAY